MQKTNKYFKSRPLPTGLGEYYQLRKDPDGNLRDMTSEKERLHKRELCKDEINFINDIELGKNRGRLLDVGCGAGFVASWIDRSKYEIYGVEVSPKASEIAKKYVKRVYVGFLEDAKFEADFFDVILCYHVIEHVEDPVVFIQQIHSILRPGGKLVIGTPNFGSAMARRFGDNFRLLHDQTHISLFDDFGLRDLLRDTGFNVDKVEYPYFDTKYCTIENFSKVFNRSKMSPPFFGSIMTQYCTKK